MAFGHVKLSLELRSAGRHAPIVLPMRPELLPELVLDAIGSHLCF